nr:hypothetical protein [Cytophagales bacterium]
MEEAENQLQRKHQPSELAKEPVIERQEGPSEDDVQTLSSNHNSAMLTVRPFAAWCGNTDVVSEMEKPRHGLCRCAMKGEIKVNP